MLFQQIQENCGAHILESAAAWAAMTGRFELGAQLLGAAARIRHETGDKPRPWERFVQGAYLPRIAEGLAPDAFADAHRRGSERSFLEALRFAKDSLSAFDGVRIQRRDPMTLGNIGRARRRTRADRARPWDDNA